MVNNHCPTLVAGWTISEKDIEITTSTKCEWWAREDSNLQPDRYERASGSKTARKS